MQGTKAVNTKRSWRRIGEVKFLRVQPSGILASGANFYKAKRVCAALRERQYLLQSSDDSTQNLYPCQKPFWRPPSLFGAPPPPPHHLQLGQSSCSRGPVCWQIDVLGALLPNINKNYFLILRQYYYLDLSKFLFKKKNFIFHTKVWLLYFYIFMYKKKHKT